jgi:hypothetical protein
MREGTQVDRTPETRSAFLPNSFGQATRHTFERAEVAPAMDGSLGVAFLFRCSETGEVRQWGFEYTQNDLHRLGMH